jgi:hypothetical protein
VRIIDRARQIARWGRAAYPTWFVFLAHFGILSALMWTDHQALAATYLLASLFLLPAGSYFYSRKAAGPVQDEPRRRQLAAVRVVTIGALLGAASVTVSAIVAVLATPTGPLGTLILVVLRLAFLPFVIGGMMLGWRRLHTGKLVLWLRRFHGAPLRGASFPSLLGAACVGLATPVTLQDDQYSYSFQAGYYRSSRSFLMLYLALPFIGIMIAVPLVLLMPDLPGSTLPIAVFLICFGIALPVWMIRQYRAKGVLRLKQPNPQTELRALLDSLRRDKRRVPGVGGLVVISVPDDHWRDAVVMTLEQSALVVIDVTELSENLTWELSTATAMLPIEKVLISCARSDRESAAECGDRIRRALTLVVGPELASKVRLFFYPDALGKSRFFVPARQPALELQGLVQESLAG